MLLSHDLLFKCNRDLLRHYWRGIFRQMRFAGTSSVGTDTPVSACFAFGPGRQLQLFSLNHEKLPERSFILIDPKLPFHSISCQLLVLNGYYSLAFAVEMSVIT